MFALVDLLIQRIYIIVYQNLTSTTSICFEVKTCTIIRGPTVTPTQLGNCSSLFLLINFFHGFSRRFVSNWKAKHVAESARLELQQWMFSFSALSIAEVHKSPLSNDVQWIGNGKYSSANVAQEQSSAV